MAVGAGNVGATGADGAPTNRALSQAKKPVSCAACALAADGAVFAAADALVGCATGRGAAMGAGASGNTPLMIGVCLLVGSCERRVTPVGSSISSAIL